MKQSAVRLVLLVAVSLCGAVPLFAQAIPPPTKEQVDKLVAVLKSEATQHEKAEACRQLGVIGTKEAVPTLAALLADEKLSHMARYGLEPIPDPAVDAALREALGKVQGRLLAGVVNSIGVRRDAKAVAPLARLLRDNDAEVAQAAARALGRIGSADAAQALTDALPGAAGASQPAVCEGLLRAAEALAAKGQRDDARAVYDQLRGLANAPHQVRAAALRGAILVRGKEGLDLLREHLRSKDYILFAAAVRTAQEIRGAEVTEALAAALPQLPGDNQIVVIQALAQRGDPAGLPALLAAAKAGQKPVRLAAIRALVQLGDDSAGAALIALMSDSDADMSRAAQEGLAALPGRQVDAAVMAMLAGDAKDRRLTALELIGRRRMTAAVPALLKAARDDDAEVRSAALKRLGELGSAAELAAMLELLMRPKAPGDVGAAEQALGAVCARADNPESAAEKLAALLARAEPPQKAALLRVLGTLGGANALKAVRAAVSDPDNEVRAAAIRALGSWKTAEAAPDLLKLAQSAADPADRTRCLRSYLGMAGRADLPADQRLAMCRQAGKLLQRDEEKRLLLAALAGTQSPDALVLIVPYLDEAAIRDEAATAAVSLAEGLLKGRQAAKVAPKLVEPLKKVAQAPLGADLAQRAKTALQQAERRARRR